MIDVNRIRQLLNEVPKPSEEPLPPGASDAEIEAFSARTGIPVPDDLREWLKVSNGPMVGPGSMLGLRRPDLPFDIDVALEWYPSWKEKGWIPIVDDGCGNTYVVPTMGEFGEGFPVVFVDNHVSDEVPAFICASSVGKFLVLLLEKELGEKHWPFDQQFVVQRDPAILDFRNVAFPWDDP